jgi:hypothetical protein
LKENNDKNRLLTIKMTSSGPVALHDFLIPPRMPDRAGFRGAGPETGRSGCNSREHGPEPLGLLDFTDASACRITVADAAFDHWLYHFRLDQRSPASSAPRRARWRRLPRTLLFLQ